MRILLVSTVIVLTLLANACAKRPPAGFTIGEIKMAENRKDAELRSLTVGYLPQAKRTVVDVNFRVPPLWKEALLDALNRSAIFKDNSKNKVSLSVRIINFDTPEFGFAMTTIVSAYYEIIDRVSGKQLFYEKVETKGVVPANYAFEGEVRSAVSRNRAVRNNIAKFISMLGKTDFKR